MSEAPGMESLQQHMQIVHKFDGSWFDNHDDDLVIMTWNVNRLMNKVHDLENYIMSFNGLVHMIVVVETFLTPENSHLCNLQNYTSFHNVRDGSGGGGVTIYVNEIVMSACSPTLVMSTVTDDLNHFMTINFKGTLDLNVTGVYRRPGGSERIFIDELDTYCLRRRKNIVCGDFNLNILDENDTQVCSYVDTITMRNFCVLNELNSRSCTRLVSRRILDHCVTDLVNKSYKLSIRHTSRSDHAILLLHVANMKVSAPIRTVRTKVNVAAAAEALREMELNCDDGNQLSDIFEQIVSDNTSEKQLRSNYRTKKPYITSEILRLIRERDVTFVLSKIHGENEILQQLCSKLCKQIRTKIEVSKKAYYGERLQEAMPDSAKQWKLYKEVMFGAALNGPRSTRVTVNGIDLVDSVDSANVINSRFATAGRELEDNIVDEYGLEIDDISGLYATHADRNWNFNTVSTSEVANIIGRLRSNKAPGIDRVPTELMKMSRDVVAPSIASCINKSITNSDFPQNLATGRLKLIHKKGDLDVDNYRGIVVTTALSKIYERWLASQLSKYTEEIGLFDNAQFGFQAASSTEDAAFQVIDYLTFHKKNYTACLFIDLKRAFETVNHIRLLAKLRRIGLSPSAVELLRTFLRRKIVTEYNGHISAPLEVSTGIGQGTILGPLLFILYINDMFDMDLKGKLVLYADDAVFMYSCDSPSELQEAMQHDLALLQKWLIINILTLNVQKTQYMLFGRAKTLHEFSLILNGEEIEKVSEFKYLGLHLDNRLRFDKHIQHIRKTISPLAGMLWRCRKYIPDDKKKQLYFSYVYSHMSYMLPIYGPYLSKNALSRLRVLQNKAIKSIFGLPRLTNTTYLYSNAILPTELMVPYLQILRVYKMRNNYVKHHTHIDTNEERGLRQTRQSQKLFVPSTDCLLARILTTFNKIDFNIDEIISIDAFKQKLRKVLIQDSDEFCIISPFVNLN